MFPTNFEDFIQMLYQQFQGGFSSQGNTFSSLNQPRNRPVTSSASPYGIPSNRMFGGIFPMRKFTSGPRQPSPPRNPFVGSQPIDGVTPLPGYRDVPPRNPRVGEQPIGGVTPLPGYRDEEFMRSQDEREQAARRKPGDTYFTMPVIR